MAVVEDAALVIIVMELGAVHPAENLQVDFTRQDHA
jgi:hypothetical protein